MVIGTGMIGTALAQADRPDVLLLASGVSNAKGHIPAECQREQLLLEQQIEAHPDKIICYISSYSINDTVTRLNTPYLQHKARMEQIIRTRADRYLIVRTSNVVGNSKQPGNLMNFIYNNLLTGKSFDVWTKTSRNLIDVADLSSMLRCYLSQPQLPLNRTIYLVHPEDTSILSIVRHFEVETGISGRFQLVNKGTYYPCDKSLAVYLFKQLGLEVTGNTKRLIRKYFKTGV